MSVKKIMRMVKVKGESTVKGGKCTTEKIRLQLRTITVALHVTICPDRAMLSVAQMQALYRLLDLSRSLSNYIHAASNGIPTCEWDIHGNVSVWNKF